MLDQLAAAFDRQDYKTAASLLKAFLKDSPQNPWGHFYRGKLSEASGDWENARKLYQQILREALNPKVVVQARQALGQIDALEQAKHQAAIAQATADPQDAELGMLILETMASAAKPTAAQAFAQIMKIDPYTARLQLPNKGWKLYRIGAIGELRLYGQQLQAANIPSFWASVTDVQTFSVFQVHHFQDYEPDALAVCENEQGQLGMLKFAWAEVSQRVEGMLPVYERVVDISPRKGIERQRKEQTQDFARICDLHLPGRRCILRLCDWKYRFDQGIEFAALGKDVIELDQFVNRLHWNSLTSFLNDLLPNKPVWSEFTSFAETVIDFPVLLQKLPSNIHMFGQESSLWNSAFHLYSNLAAVRCR
ncbi:tetratricopeptide repeat protein [Myxacorys almedinensis]|uniref:Tetratricopeptide repeat protein n=1 Tax=Myxacorys almedinensis A TaxID=2690445 RepID=A0A8J7Z3U2_9CYAN|nr:tetratricopeptide repeat protein [Myxacorys almedinensis]NDJ17618.1 tetratricopeptide repeat protein [Myxacorys almedinensis A]